MTDYRYIGFGQETQWGTSVAITTFVDFIKEGTGQNRNTNHPETAGFMETRSGSTGPYDTSGGIDFLAVPDELAIWLRMLFGTPTTSDLGSGGFAHTYKPTKASTPYTLQIGKDSKAETITSAFCSGGNIKLTHGDDVFCTFDIGGEKKEITNSTAPSFTSAPTPLHGTGWATTINDVAEAAVQSMEYTFELDIQDDYRRNNQFRAAAPRGMLRTKMSMDLSFVTEKQLKLFMAGNSTAGAGAWTPQDSIVAFPVSTVITGALIGGAISYSLALTTPRVVFDTESCNVDTRKLLVESITGEAIYDNSQASAIMVVLQDTQHYIEH